MDAFLQQPRARQGLLCERAGDELGLSPEAVEKDFWVCWVLRELFRLDDVASHLTFKGGTSLSKCWGFIERFSEDIDLVLGRDFLGFGGEAAPEAAPSRNERARRVENVLAACQRHVGETLLPTLRSRVRAQLGEDRSRALVLDPDDQDQQAILFEYEPLFSTYAYLRPVVKIELGARSDVDPNMQCVVKPYVANAPGYELGECSFEVRAVAPERTFWEKVSLLHEEAYRDGGPRARLARHYYDLWCLGQRGVSDRALGDLGLFERVANHRRVFFPRGKGAHRELAPGSVRLVPAEDRLRAWASDYGAMRDTMFFGAPPSFETIMTEIRVLEQRINQAGARSP